MMFSFAAMPNVAAGIEKPPGRCRAAFDRIKITLAEY
jgi:hypothetical protein